MFAFWRRSLFRSPASRRHSASRPTDPIACRSERLEDRLLLAANLVIDLPAQVDNLVVIRDGNPDDGYFRVQVNGLITDYALPTDSITINGGNGNDTFRFLSMDSTFTGTITFNGGVGNNSAEIDGTAGNDVARFNPTYATVVGPQYDIEVFNSNTIRVHSNGGNDTALLYDSYGDDLFVGSPTTARLVHSFGTNYADGFANVIANSYRGGNDVAHLHDSAGDDTFVASHADGKARLDGTGYHLETSAGYGTLYAHALNGGNDRAFLSDGTTLITSGNSARLISSGRTTYVDSFEQTSTERTETVLLHDATGDDTFVANPNYVRMVGDGYQSSARNFTGAKGYSVHGGADVAYLHDSSGDDTLVAGSNEVRVEYDAGIPSNFAVSFEQTYGFALNGGTDTAYMHDSAANDMFVSTESIGRLYGTGFDNSAQGFESVIALALYGGNDTATFYDTPANDTFIASTTVARMNSTTYQREAKFFEQVTAFAVNGGVDASYLYGSDGDDSFTSYGLHNHDRLAGTGFQIDVYSFNQTQAFGNGGDDSAVFYLAHHDYQLVAHDALFYVAHTRYASSRVDGFDTLADKVTIDSYYDGIPAPVVDANAIDYTFESLYTNQ